MADLQWDVYGVAEGSKGTYRVRCENWDNDQPMCFYADIRRTGFPDWQELLEDPSRVGAQVRASQYDVAPL